MLRLKNYQLSTGKSGSRHKSKLYIREMKKLFFNQLSIPLQRSLEFLPLIQIVPKDDQYRSCPLIIRRSKCYDLAIRFL